MEIAVVGAGLAGLTAAHDLAAVGHRVVVWEKSRGVGGRTATRRGPDGLRFDHGAPVLHDGAHGLAALSGLAAHTLRPGRETVTVGDGANTAPAKALAEGLDVRTGVQVAAVAADGKRWVLFAADRLSPVTEGDRAYLGSFHAVVVTAPGPQAAELLAVPAPRLAVSAASVAFAPCWAVMAAWEVPLELTFTGARDAHGLAWAMAEAPKPGRAPGERWVLHADAALSRAHLEDSPEAVVEALLARFAALAGRSLPAPAHAAAHRWRFSRPVTPLPERVLRDGSLLAAGDWCGGDDAGAAVRSGRAAAAALLRG